MVIVTGTARLREGARDAFVEAVGPYVAGSLAEEGCTACRYAFDVSDPDVVTFHEEFADRDALGAHHAAEHLATFGAASGGLMAGPPDATMWVGAERASMR